MNIYNLKTYLNTGITNTYYARSNYWDFIKHCFRNGKWSIMPISISDHYIFSTRHLVPLFFTSGLLLVPLLSLVLPWMIYLLLFQLLLYLPLNIYFSCISKKNTSNLLIIPTIFILYFTLHFVYGLGSLSVIHLLIKGKQ